MLWGQDCQRSSCSCDRTSLIVQCLTIWALPVCSSGRMLCAVLVQLCHLAFAMWEKGDTSAASCCCLSPFLLTSAIMYFTVHDHSRVAVHIETETLVARPVDYVTFDNTVYHEKVSQYAKSLPEPVAVPKDTTEIRLSGPQGLVEPLTIIDDPADWRSQDLKPEDYTYRLTETEVAEIIAATDSILARGVKDEEDIKKLTRDDYLPHWPTLVPKLKELALNVTDGRGFQIIKGFPVERYASNRPGLVVAYWGLALVLGRVQISQTDKKSDGTVFGSILNHVTVGRFARVYKDPKDDPVIGDSSFLSFHSDQGATDLISLLSVTAAKEGGESLLVSAIAIHNELLRRGRKDLVEVLSTPGIWWTAKQTDQRGARPLADGTYAGGYEQTQPFEYHQGYLSVHFGAKKFTDTAKDLTPLQEEAIWTVAAIAEDPSFHLKLKLEPGDIEWLHNPSTFHARTAVVDGENRHLLRWWVHTDANPRPVAPHYAPRSNVGPEGGFLVPGYPDLSLQRLPLYPYSRHDGLGQSHVE